MRRFPIPADEADLAVTVITPEELTLVPVDSLSGTELAVQPPALPCANCGTALAGPYCFHCGQHTADYHRSVWRFLADFFDNTFCWDNKFLLTVQPLVCRPGLLTREFMTGRRVRYVHPLRLFLFNSAVCLTLIGFIHHHTGGKAIVTWTGKTHKKGTAAKAAAKPAASPVASDDPDDEDAVQAARQSAPGAAPVSPSPVPAGMAGPPPGAGPGAESFAAKIQQVLAASATHASPGGVPTASVPPFATPPAGVPPRATPTPSASPGETKDDLGTQIEALVKTHNPKDAKKAAEAGEKIGKMMQDRFDSADMGRMVDEITQGVEQRLSWVALALLPVFALFVRAVYWRRDSYYFEHLVFSLHYHAFLFVFWLVYVVLGVAAASMPLSGLWNALLICSLTLPAWYLYLALRRMYAESRRRTAAKVALITSLHLLAIMMGVSAVGAVAYFSTRR